MRLAILAAITGCGRTGFDAVSDGAIVHPDAACHWSTPQKLPAIVQSSEDDWYPTPTLAGAEVFFYSYRTNPASAFIYHVPTNPYGPPIEHTELEAASPQQKFPALPDDALEIFYTATGAAYRIYSASRMTTGSAFGAPAQVPNIAPSGGANDYSPWVSADGLRMVFVSDRNGPVNLFETTRPARGQPWAAPLAHAELGAIDTVGMLVSGATLSPDGLAVYFSKVIGTQYDVFTAQRPALDQAFGAAAIVPELSSVGDDLGLRLDAAGTVMFLNYDAAAAGFMNADLYSSSLACP